MEAIGFTIGVVSIASIFQTCLHGYRSLNTAMAIGNTALTLNIQFRIEELRLYLWGRNWGLIEEIEEMNGKIDSKAGLEAAEATASQESIDAASDSTSITAVRTASLLDKVDEELEIPGLRDLTVEVLGRIQKALEEWKLVGERYTAADTSMSQKGDGTSQASQAESSTQALSKVSAKQKDQAKAISDRNRFTAKLRWALKDKGDMEELLTKLTNLNDSLEKLLPRREKTSLARGLAGEILNILESEKTSAPDSDLNKQLQSLRGPNEAKAAQILLLNLSNNTETPERKSKEEPPAERTPFSKRSVWEDGPQGAMEILQDQFLKLAEPKLKYYEIAEEGGRWISSNYVPLQRSVALYAPIPGSTEPSSSDSNQSADNPTKAVLVEWRPTATESSASQLTVKDLKERRDHIAKLLHRTSATDGDFRVLDCLGYTKADGHLPNGSTHELVGYVYQYPDFASPKSLPVSLRDLVGEAYDSDDPRTPSLDERLNLARKLAVALYQLQCAGWVHRKISSYNVIFFKNRATDELDLSQPFLMGWQYSRPDDQRRIYPSERASPGIGDLDMYVHRSRIVEIDKRKRFPRFRKSFDIYSLGIVLVEIAFWEPIMALAKEEQRKMMVNFESVPSTHYADDWWKTIRKTAKEELAPEMGVAYRDAVLFCLEGENPKEEKRDKSADWEERHWDESDDPYYVETDFEEVGLEKQFYWRVLKALEGFRTQQV